MLLRNQQFWLVAIGALVPILAYFANAKIVARVWAGTPEPIRAFVHVAFAAGAAAVYEAMQAGTFGWNEPTAQAILTAVAAALAAHKLLWQPSGTNVAVAALRLPSGGLRLRSPISRPVAMQPTDPPPPPPPTPGGENIAQPPSGGLV